MRVMVVTMFSPEYKAIADYTVPVMKEYAVKHGYAWHTIELSDHRYPYVKIEWFLKLFNSFAIDAIFYLDSDAVITNHNTKVESFMDEKHDLYVCRDMVEINFGALIIKNTTWSKEFLETILRNRDRYDNEQNWLNYYYYFLSIKTKTKICEHPAFNSYDYRLYQEFPEVRGRDQGHHHDGDFVFHVPALHPDKRLEVLKQVKIIK